MDCPLRERRRDVLEMTAGTFGLLASLHSVQTAIHEKAKPSSLELPFGRGRPSRQGLELPFGRRRPSRQGLELPFERRRPSRQELELPFGRRRPSRQGT